MDQHQVDASITTAVVDGVFTIAINRPDKKNALTFDMYVRLTEAVQRAESDDAVRVIFIHGAGGNFTSGNDLNDFLESPQRTKVPLFSGS